MSRLIFNVVRVGRSRRVVENGEEWFVAPITLIVPGVLNGSKGALFYPPDEVRSAPGIWNGTPLTIRHPTCPLTNAHLSAGDLDDADRFGEIRNDRYDGKRRAEAWASVSKLKAAMSSGRACANEAKQVYLALKHSRPMEISTGLYTDNESAVGRWKGQHYDAIARNYQPDHVAILPNEVGACSLDDGCGLNVNKRGLTVNSVNRILRKVRNAEPTENTWSDSARDAAAEARRAKSAGSLSKKDEKRTRDATEATHDAARATLLTRQVSRGGTGNTSENHENAAYAHVQAAEAHEAAAKAHDGGGNHAAAMHHEDAAEAHWNSSNFHSRMAAKNRMTGNAKPPKPCKPRPGGT
jgi:hypothetical protein